MGFSYGNDEGSDQDDDGSGASTSGSDSGEDGEGEDAGAGMGDADGLAANLGIDSFSATLRRAEREEAALALGLKPRKKCANPAPEPARPHHSPCLPARACLHPARAMRRVTTASLAGALQLARDLGPCGLGHAGNIECGSYSIPMRAARSALASKGRDQAIRVLDMLK